MKLKESQLYKLVTDVVKTAISKQRLRQLFRVSLYSNAFYLAVSSAATSLFGFVFWIIVSRVYSLEDVGLASAAIAAMGLVGGFAHLGLGMGLIRFLPYSGKNANSMINTVFTIGTLTSIAAAFIFIGGLGFWSPALLSIRQNLIYLAAFVLFTIATTLSILIRLAFVAERRTGFVLAEDLIATLLRLLLVVVLAIFFRSFAIFASWGISLGVSILLSVFLFLPRAQPGYRPFFAVNRGAVNNMLHFSLANYLSDLFWTAPAVILPIMVVNLLGAEPNAYFYIAWAVGGIVTVIPIAFSTSLFAEGSYNEERLGLNIWRSLKMILVILMPAVVLVLVIAPQLLLLFGSPYSANATTLLRIVAISALPFAINVVYLAIKRVKRELKIIVALPTFAAAATIGLSFLLLPQMGINGAGIAWLATQGIIALVIIASSLKKRRLLR